MISLMQKNIGEFENEQADHARLVMSNLQKYKTFFNFLEDISNEIKEEKIKINLNEFRKIWVALKTFFKSNPKR